MRKLSISIKIYIGLIITLAILAAINVYLPQDAFLSTQDLPSPKIILALINAGVMIILYGSFGLLGLKFLRKLGFPDLMDLRISNTQRFLIPLLIGFAIGLVFIITDIFLSQFHSLGQFPHPSFPASLIASAIAGIGEELIFRLFFISFWVWLISYVILKNRWQNQVFWIVTFFSALAFALGHIPSIMIIYGFKTIGEIPSVFMIEIILLNGIVSIFAAYYFRKFGFLASIGIHFWTDIIWHVIYGVI